MCCGKQYQRLAGYLFNTDNFVEKSNDSNEFLSAMIGSVIRPDTTQLSRLWHVLYQYQIPMDTRGYLVGLPVMPLLSV